MNGAAIAQLLPVGLAVVALGLWVLIRANSSAKRDAREAVLGRILVLALVLGPAVQATLPQQPLWVGTAVSFAVTCMGVTEAGLMPRARSSGPVAILWVSLLVWWTYVSFTLWAGAADLSISILTTPVWVWVLYRTSPGYAFLRRGIFPALVIVMWVTLLMAPSGLWLPRETGDYLQASSEPFEGSYFTWLSSLMGVPGRYGGFFIDPNMLGLLCVLSTAVALAVGGRGAVALMVPTAGLLLMSSSRASMAGTCVVVAIALINQGRRGKFRLIGLASLGVVGGVLVTSLLRGLGADASGTLTATGRLDVWRLAVAELSQAPLFGQWYRQGSEAVLGESWALGHIHNSLLQVAWQFGVVGVVLWGAWAFNLIRVGWARRSRPLLAGYVIAAMFGSYASTPFVGVPFLIVVTVAALATNPDPALKPLVDDPTPLDRSTLEVN